MKRGLNQRQLEFIKMLADEPEYRPVSYYARKLSVSDKTAKSDLNVLRETFAAGEVEIEAKTGKGIRAKILGENRMEFLSQLFEKGQEQWGTKERRSRILKRMLLQSEEATSVEKLSEIYYVGRTSIVNDLKYIEKKILPYHLSVEKSKKGTRIVGKEKDLRSAIAELLHLDVYTLSGLMEIFAPEDIVFAESLMADLDLNKHLMIGDVYYNNMLTHLLICIRRVQEGNGIEEEDDVDLKQIHDQEFYQGALYIADKIEAHYGIRISRQEIVYVYQYISVIGMMDQTPGTEKRKKALSEEFAERMTEYMAAIVGVKPEKEEYLYQNLQMHIRHLMNRIKYKIKIQNPMLDEIQNSYPQIVGICQLVCQILNERFQLTEIHLDEIAGLAAYYQTMLMQTGREWTVLVVCHSGFGTSQLLASRLRDTFPEFCIRDVIPVRKLESEDLNGIDLIISTVALEPQKVKSLVISSFLSERDINLIRNSFDLIKGTVGEEPTFFYELRDRGQVDFDLPALPGEERKIAEARILPQAVARVWKSPGDADGIYITIDAAAGCLYIDVVAREVQSLKIMLRRLYRFIMDEAFVYRLLECETLEDLYKL